MLLMPQSVETQFQY